jgi:hypothetical protein
MVILSSGNKHLLAAHWNKGSIILHLPRWSIFWMTPKDEAVFSERYVDRVIGKKGRGYRLRIKKR